MTTEESTLTACPFEFGDWIDGKGHGPSRFVALDTPQSEWFYIVDQLGRLQSCNGWRHFTPLDPGVTSPADPGRSSPPRSVGEVTP